ncbi:MAG: transglycosylase domain-containing protein [Flavicella sp.]
MRKKILKFFLELALLIAVLISLFIGIVYIGGFGPIPSTRKLTQMKQAQASLVFSEDAQILGSYFQKNRTQVNFKDIPSHLIEALVATEDARFYKHDGIDKIALARVFVKSILMGNRSAGGGSTLSQQLAKNLFQRKDFSFLSMPVNKTKEAILAYRLESYYSKEEILTLYLNTVPFGERVYGIETAAQRYFSKKTRDLKLHQAAVLVGILKANTYYNPRLHPDHAKKRRNVVLNQMLKAGYIDEATYQKTKKKPLDTHYRNLQQKNPNGYFLKEVKKEADSILNTVKKDSGETWNIFYDGLTIETTLNAEMQNTALRSRQQHLVKLQKHMDKYWNTLARKKSTKKIIDRKVNNSRVQNPTKRIARSVFNWQDKTTSLMNERDSIVHYLKMVQAAVYGMELEQGGVQVYVGGNSYEYLPYNLVKSERQVASTFKPFVFAAALENGQKPCKWINNEVRTYKEYQNWKPENYDHTDGGYYSMGGALAKSMNIPTIETYLKLGTSKVQETALQFGLTKPLKDVPATALGTTNYSLQQLVHAYALMATRGYLLKPHFIKSIKNAEGKVLYQFKKNKQTTIKTIKPKTLETLQYLLKGVVDKGTAKKLKNNHKARGSWAGKTGTAQNYSDSWFIGFNSRFIMGSWVGCSYPSINLPKSIGGGSVAAMPIVANVIAKKYTSKRNNRNLSAGFPPFSSAVKKACDCDFYRDENSIEKLFDLFDSKENKDEQKKEKEKKKKGFFSRLFGRKKK